MIQTAPIDADRTRRALKAASQIGPYFVVGTGPRTDDAAAEDPYDARRLDDLAHTVGRRLGTDETRVAASSLQYEIAERLWSIAIGAWLVDGLVVDLRTLTWRAAPNGRIRLHLADPVAFDHRHVDPAQTAMSIGEMVVVGQLCALHGGLRAVTRIAEGLLWGNAATALVLATQTMYARGHDDRVLALSTGLLASPPLANRLVGDITGKIMRRTCCLYYRTSARRTCGDCPLSGSAAVERRA